MFVELLKDHFGQKAGARVDVDQAYGDFLIAQGTAKKVDGNPVEDLVAKALGDGMTKITEGLTQAVDSAIQQFVTASGKRQAPFGTSGPVGQDSEGYSVLKAAAFANGYIPADQAKEEIHVHEQLLTLYKGLGFVPHFGAHAFLVPVATEHLPTFLPEGKKLQGEIRQKMLANQGRFDPDEARWISQKTGFGQKALGKVSDTAGGVIVGFPSLGEMIELQRNLEVFANAGCHEISLPPNGRIQFPKLTGGATANWVGEATSIAESTPTTGNLDMQAKKVAIFVNLNNELLRFASPSAEVLMGYRCQPLLPRGMMCRHRFPRFPSRRTRSAWLPDLEDPTCAEKAHIERLEEVELSEQKRNLIRIGPGHRQAHGRRLSNRCLDHDTACINLRQRSRESDFRLLGLPVEPQLNAQRIRQHTDGRPAVHQSYARQRVRLMAKEDGQVRHQVQPSGSRVPVAVGKLLDNAHERVSSSLRSRASWAAASGAYSGV
jgi:hypothetical protein